MEKENSVDLKAGEVSGRSTCARAAGQENPKQDSPKKAVSDDTSQSRNKQSVLQDTTNICHENTNRSSVNSSKVQAKKRNLTEPAQPNVPRPPRPAAVVDIDADVEDPQICSPYAAGIYNKLRVLEVSRGPHSNYMEIVQHHINPKMRAILVNWLVEVCEKFELLEDTLYLTVFLIDWFLSTNNIKRSRFQLLGITCLSLASKYEEIYPPTIKDLCFITENTYTEEEVRKMEIQVWKSSEYQLFAPTTKTFLRRFLRAAQASYTRPNIDLEHLANYLAELALMNYDFIKFLPSMIAASAVFLARWTLNSSSHPWNPTLEHYACYKATDLRTTIFALQQLQLNTNNCTLTYIRTKYRQDKYNHVAVLRSPEVLESLFRSPEALERLFRFPKMIEK